MLIRQAHDNLSGEYVQQLTDELNAVRDTYKVFCPDCDHSWDGHRPLGCAHGWEHNASGIPITEGCRCQNRRGGVWAVKPAPK